MNRGFTPRSLNQVPRSDKISHEMPTLQNTDRRASATETDVISFNGMVSVNPVAKSMRVKMDLCPAEEAETKGPTMSMTTLEKGSVRF